MESFFSWAPKVATVESVRVDIGMPVVRIDGRSVGRSRNYLIFWDGEIYLPMVLRWRASRAELRYKNNFPS